MEKQRDTHLLEEELQGLRDVLEVAKIVVSSLELDAVLDNLLQHAMAMVDVPAGSIALYDPNSERLVLHAHAGLSESITGKNSWRVKSGGFSHRIFEQSEPVVLEDTRGVSFFKNPLAIEEGIRALIAVPLKVQETIVGVLYLDDFEPRRFPESRRRLLPILASFAAMSIENARLHQQARDMACTDELTGLFNYRHLQTVLEREVSGALRAGQTLSLIMFDIDDFKQFNDCHGHLRGDEALKSVAAIFRKALRNCDITFRYGGEEFVAILPETTAERALVAAERIRSDIAAESADQIAGDGPGLTVSVGVASCPEDGNRPETLLKCVDELLYRAKHAGKNQVISLSEQAIHGR